MTSSQLQIMFCAWTNNGGLAVSLVSAGLTLLAQLNVRSFSAWPFEPVLTLSRLTGYHLGHSRLLAQGHRLGKFVFFSLCFSIPLPLLPSDLPFLPPLPFRSL
jgi:hypothetical protein